MTPPAQKTLAIAGLGLLGTSLGMALRGSCYRRLGWARKAEVRDWVLAHDGADEVCGDLETFLKRADLVILCLPIPVICDTLERYAGVFRPGSVVTDIGSDKSVIVATGERFLEPRGVHFVGSHPMAGTEKSGCSAAFPELYHNAEVFVTPTARTSPEALREVEMLWETLGTKVRRIAPDEHDKLVAHTSHISHLLALALTLTVLDCDNPEEEALRYSGCATGFRDTSRIASSSPAMWREIVENNRTAVLDAGRRFERIYAEVMQTIAAGDFDAFEAMFARGKELRDAWMKYKKASAERKQS